MSTFQNGCQAGRPFLIHRKISLSENVLFEKFAVKIFRSILALLSIVFLSAAIL